MSKSKQITIPARTSNSVSCNVRSGLVDLTSYTFIMTVKRTPALPAIVFTVDGTVDGTSIIFDITADQSDIKPDTYRYDVIGIKGEERVPIIKGDLIIELWPSSVE